MANYAIGSIGYDTTFELNEFNEPKLRSEMETLKNVLLFVLFTKPGQYPSLPTVGLNIGSSLYEFYDEIDVDDIKTQIIVKEQKIEVLRINNNEYQSNNDGYH